MAARHVPETARRGVQTTIVAEILVAEAKQHLQPVERAKFSLCEAAEEALIARPHVRPKIGGGLVEYGGVVAAVRAMIIDAR